MEFAGLTSVELAVFCEVEQEGEVMEEGIAVVAEAGDNVIVSSG